MLPQTEIEYKEENAEPNANRRRANGHLLSSWDEKTMSIKDRLLAHLSQFPAAPFLFVGSGLSKRYVGLDAWKDLLRRFADVLPKAFGYYASKANDNMPALASLMAEEFHEIWWNSPE